MPDTPLAISSDDAIAVVGASALFPGSPDGSSFWRNILAGSDLLSDVPADHWLIEDYYDPDPSAVGKTYARRGGFLPKVDFDPLRHGIPPKQLSTTDTAQLLALIVAQRVLEDAASVQFGKVDRRDISVILGVASATELVGQMAARIQRPHWVKALRDAGLPESQVEAVCDGIEATYPEWDESTFPGLLGNVVAGRIANRLDLGGTNCVIDAACASSLGAVAMAVQELQLGHSDLVITGGVDALNDIFMYMCFSKTPALSPTGDCRPFSDAADGTMLGEGIGMLALRRLADAERDGDRIYAVLRGVGASSDGRAKSIYAPRASGQEIAIRRAYERAGYGPGEVGLIEGHGTATKAGDLAEFEGLTRAFADSGGEDRQWCALGSVKSQIGHTKSAAGAASLFKVVMALHHKVLPPTIKVDRPGSKLGIENTPFYLNTRARPWIQEPGRSRKAGVSSFGFGGSNFHVTLEEYLDAGSPARRVSSLPTHLLLLGADDAATLVNRAGALREEFAARPLPYIAQRSQLAFDRNSVHRLAILADDVEEALARLATALTSIQADGGRAFSLPNRVHYAVGGEAPRVAFLFPGQGSQYVDMGAELAIELETARLVWDESVSTPLADGKRLDQIVFPIPVFSDEARAAQAAELTRTDRAQPAIGMTSLSMLRVLEKLGVRPDATGGHSYGEIPALHAAGVIDSSAEVLAISRRRGELMYHAASMPGSMSAVQAGVAEVEALLASSGAAGVTLANVNSPRQVVVAGETGAIEAFESVLGEEAIRFRRLSVATAFHTALVAPSAEPFGEFLRGVPVRAPRIPVYSNTSAAPYGTDADEIRGTLAEQLARPVRFLEMVGRMYEDGFRLFVEVGPSSVLTGMVGDCLAGRAHVAVAMDARRRDGRAGLLDVLAVLSTQGVAVDYGAFWEEFAELEGSREEVALSPATVQLNGANHGKPYPPINGAAGRPAPNAEIEANAGHGFGARAAGAMAPGSRQAATPWRGPTAHDGSPEQHEGSGPTARDSHPAGGSNGNSAGSLREQPGRPIDAGWSSAFMAMQQHTLDAQKEFTRALSESHQAFLRASEAAFSQLGSLRHDGQRGDTAALAWTGHDAPRDQRHSGVTGMADVQPTNGRVEYDRVRGSSADPDRPVGSSGSSTGASSFSPHEARARTPEAPPASRTEPPTEAGPRAATTPRSLAPSDHDSRWPAMNGGSVSVAPPADSPAVAYAELLLEVVAEKTGYPVEMLTLDMELESGLGIDSIKRVEILSLLQERVPGLAGVEPSELAALNTLGEIVAFSAKAASAVEMASGANTGKSGLRGAAGPAESGITLGTGASTASSGDAPSVDYEGILMEVVAEKTGYPVEMLSLEMELESGLGIDSIKRVEILSVLQEKVPALAEVDTSELAALNTLGEIVAFAANAGSSVAGSGSGAGFDASGVAGPRKPAAEATRRDTGSPATRGPAIDHATVDYAAVLFEVVAEKTGYPVEMLSLEMELESGLGIDSIKRVEILSVLQEKVPALAEVDTSELAALNTLGEIVAFAARVAGGVTEAAETSNAPAAFPDSPAPAAAALPAASPLRRTVVEWAEIRPTGLLTPGLLGADPLYLVGPEPQLTEALAEELRGAGIHVATVATPPEDARAVILLTGLGASGADAQQQASLNEEVFLHLKACAPSMAAGGRLLVTVQDTGGDFGIGGRAGNRAWSAGVGAAAKTAALEWAGVSVKAIDIEIADRAPSAIAAALAAELLAGGPRLEVGLRADGGRGTPTLREEDAPVPVRAELNPHGVLVVTGGGRGVTAACLAELLARSPVKVAILGRTELTPEPEGLEGLEGDAELKSALLRQHREAGREVSPHDLGSEARAILARRELRRNLDDLRLTGAEVSYHAVDVTNAAALESALATIRREQGPITGLIHGAGVLADREIEKKTPDQFRRVFSTKVDALRNLLHAMRDDALTHLVCFSSVTARGGNVGQVDYAMANEVLNRVCQGEALRRGDACLVKAIGWGPWAGGMVNAGLEKHFAAIGVGLIPLRDGARFFADEVTGRNGLAPEIVYGAGLDDFAGRGAADEGTFEVRFHRATHGYIGDHAIRGVPVVPVVAANDLAMHAVAALFPAAAIAGTGKLKVVKGIQLQGFDTDGDLFRIECRKRPGRDGLVTVRIVSAAGVVHYTLDVMLGESGSSRAEADAWPLEDLEPWQPESGSIYDGRLFHGPGFQSIRSLEGISDSGCAGTLRAVRPGETGLVLELEVMDGGLQLPVLWIHEHEGTESLPTGVAAIRLHSSFEPGSTVRCEAICVFRSPLAARWNVRYLAESGEPVCTIEGLEVHLLGSAKRARPESAVAAFADRA